jgi:hypothetical protein
MAIPEKLDSECAEVRVNLCGEIKKAVVEKRDLIRKSETCSKEKAVKAIIKEWMELKLISDKM